jgi:hypothetical protein
MTLCPSAPGAAHPGRLRSKSQVAAYAPDVVRRGTPGPWPTGGRSPPLGGGAPCYANRMFNPRRRYCDDVGIGFGDRLSREASGQGAKKKAKRKGQKKKAMSWPFAKPSDGLERSTPSLPSNSSDLTRWLEHDGSKVPRPCTSARVRGRPGESHTNHTVTDSSCGYPAVTFAPIFRSSRIELGRRARHAPFWR